jgi:prephenate dehydrogenase
MTDAGAGAALPPAVGVVGLGVIGGSLARALLARGVPVLGTARDPADARAAAGHGVRVLPGAADVAAALPAGGALVLAVPPAALGAAAAAALPGAHPGVLVLHAAGLQSPAAAGLGDAHARVLGTHPLAGSHAAGFGASRADLFAGATVWAEARAGDDARRRLDALWRAAGAARIRYAPADAHYRTMAWASHLPQLAAVALAGALAGAGVPAADGGPGLRDATRLAASPLPLWRDLLAAAPRDTRDALAALADGVATLRAALDALDAGDDEPLAACWSPATAWRAGAPGGAPAATLAPTPAGGS